MSLEVSLNSAVVHKLRGLVAKADHRLEIQLLLRQMEAIENSLVDHCQYQDSVLADLTSLTSEVTEVTPRFMSSREGLKPFDEGELEGCSDAFNLGTRALRRVNSQISRCFDLEQQIVTTYKNALNLGSAFQLRPERPRLEENASLAELKFLYEQEVKKVGRLTERHNNIQEEFKELQDFVEELTEERERLQAELARHEEPEIASIKKQLHELESSMRKDCMKCASRKEKLVTIKEQLGFQTEEISDLQTNLALADQKVEFL